jgi:hypothetical protein
VVKFTTDGITAALDHTKAENSFDKVRGEDSKGGKPTEAAEGEGDASEDSESLFFPADQILLAAGPWSGALLEGLPSKRRGRILSLFDRL